MEIFLDGVKYRVYDQDCLSKEFLVTSRKTAFQIAFLYQKSLDINFFHGSFNSMAQHFDHLHLGELTHSELKDSGERLQLCRKRIREGWLLYSLLGK